MAEKDEMMTVNENAAEQKTKKAKKEKKEKKPVDKAKRKKVRRVVMAVLAVVLIASFSVSRMAAANAPVMVPTTPAQTGEVEQTVNTSGTVVANTSKSYFSEVKVKIGKVNVAVGDAVKAGDLLISFDIDQIKAEGYDVVTPVLVCNTDDYASVDAVTGNDVEPGDTIIKITK